jgi:hypothetical protein
MSFLNTNYSATVAARLTQKGRNSIAKGDFLISYFAIGDSEYNYSGTTSQGVFAPLDKDTHVKYPLKYTNDDLVDTTVYGIPVDDYIKTTCSNVMPADGEWTLNVVWDKKPIGLGPNDRNLTGYQSNIYTGTKEFLGYTSSDGQTSNTGTTIVNTMGESVIVKPEEQKCVALIHFSKNGIMNDPYRFFKYDDYISTSTNVTSPNSVSDKEYFELTIPSIYYHRNHSATAGATFYMGDTTKQIISNYNSKQILDYRDLIDENDNRVGKIFHNNKTIVIDDEELVAVLDGKSERNYTLTAPKVSSVITNDSPIEDFTTGTTLWVTYMLANNTTGGLPCNYVSKVTGTTNPINVTVKFDDNEFTNLNTQYTANKFYILFQFTTDENGVSKPPASGSQWLMLDYTSAAGTSLGNLKTGHTFTINEIDINSATTFTLSTYTGENYALTSGPYFGDEATHPGTVSVVRSTDIEEMKFLVNLPSGKFTDSQNPTYASGNARITEVALLNSNKEALVMGKLATPLERNGGAQVISIKLDF